MEISISPKKAAWTLLSISCLLFVGSSLAAYSTYVLGHGRLFGIIWMLELDSEIGIGTLRPRCSSVDSDGSSRGHRSEPYDDAMRLNLSLGI